MADDEYTYPLVERAEIEAIAYGPADEYLRTLANIVASMTDTERHLALASLIGSTSAGQVDERYNFTKVLLDERARSKRRKARNSS